MLYAAAHPGRLRAESSLLLLLLSVSLWMAWMVLCWIGKSERDRRS